MVNLQLIENQPRWRVWLIARAAQILGVLIHVEGIPFGSSRNHRKGTSASGGVAGPQGDRLAQADENYTLAKKTAQTGFSKQKPAQR